MKHDSKFGQGKITLSNGQTYTGKFREDRVHGEGAYSTIDGDTIKGLWKNGILVK